MFFIKFAILIIYTISNVSCNNGDTQYLTDLFFANLENDPHINGT